ncbi:MAG: hypothetical protein PVG94_08330 [Gammaproteobacteria bacterium]|jgi:hypothetical protein
MPEILFTGKFASYVIADTRVDIERKYGGFMRNPVVLIWALTAPVSVSAHSGAHDGMGLVDGIAHMPGGHIAPLVALFAVLLVSRGIRKRRDARASRRDRSERNEGRS